MLCNLDKAVVLLQNTLIKRTVNNRGCYISINLMELYKAVFMYVPFWLCTLFVGDQHTMLTSLLVAQASGRDYPYCKGVHEV